VLVAHDTQEETMETFKKRQKAWARKEKQQQKAARRMQRRYEKAKSGDKPAGGDSPASEPRAQQ
jgi:hypothetical protein